MYGGVETQRSSVTTYLSSDILHLSKHPHYFKVHLTLSSYKNELNRVKDIMDFLNTWSSSMSDLAVWMRYPKDEQLWCGARFERVDV